MARTMVSIGAGSGQYGVIAAACRLGFQVVGVDRAPHARSAALLSKWIENSTYDADGVVAKLEALQNGYDFAGVVARTSGPAVMTAACAAAALHTRGVSEAFARVSVSKAELRESARMLGVEVVEGAALRRAESPPFKGPWVVKPDQPVIGKQNVRLVHDEKDFNSAFSAAAEESQNDAVETEVYVEGVDIGFMVLMSDGQWVCDLLYDEYTDFENGRAMGRGIGAPSCFVNTVVETRARDVAQRLLSAWAMRDGFAFFSFRVDAHGNTYLFEANPGLCGDDIAERVLPDVYSDFDPFEAEVRAMSGLPVTAPVRRSVLVALVDGEILVFDAEAQRMTGLSQLPGMQEMVGKLDALRLKLGCGESL